MDEIKYCRKCGDELTNDNWTPGLIKKDDRLCKECNKIKSQLWRKNNKHRHLESGKNYYYQHGGTSMYDNKKCGLYLGVVIIEDVLSQVFNNVQRMPNGNPGFDFICDKGYKIDVKSSCRRVSKNRNHSDYWKFDINYNKIPHYFLLVGLNNREDLNPEHVWLIRGDMINNKSSTGISESQLLKWDKYTVNKIDQIIRCCDTLR